MDHICPLGYVTIDWILNSMKYESTLIWINLGVALLYGIVNIIVTKVSGEPVYPPFITWDSFLSWMIGVAILPFFALIFYLEYWATNWKISKITINEGLIVVTSNPSNTSYE